MMLRKHIVLAATAILVLVLASPVMAQVSEVEYEGVVNGSPTTENFQLLVGGTDEYTVIPPLGFPLDSLTDGDVVMVTGTLADSTITASSVLLSVALEGIVQAIDTETFDLFSETELYTVTPNNPGDLGDLGVGDSVLVTGWLDPINGTITDATIEILLVYVELTGTVQSVGAETFVFMDTESNVYTVIPPGGFNLGLLSAGDPVMVYGLLRVSDNTITASAVWVYVKVVGDVLSVDGGTFQFQIDGGPMVTVTSLGGFEIASLGVGDILLISGWHWADHLMATEIRVLFRGDGEGTKGGHYCQDLDESHPVARYIAEHYGPFYQEVMSWFCVGRFGFGEIKNMFKAWTKLSDEGISTWDIMAMKEEIGGWGNVWKALGLKDNNGKKDQHTDPVTDTADEPDQKETGKPDKTEKEDNKPEHTGPPDHANNNKDKDKNK